MHPLWHMKEILKSSATSAKIRYEPIVTIAITRSSGVILLYYCNATGSDYSSRNF